MIKSSSKSSVTNPESPMLKDSQVLRKTLSRVTALFEDEFLLTEDGSDKPKKRNIFARLAYYIMIGIVFAIPYFLAISFQTTDLLNNSQNIKANPHDIVLQDNGPIFLSQELQRWSILLISTWASFVVLRFILTIIPFIAFEILKVTDSNAGHLAKTLVYMKGLKRSIIRLGGFICLSAVCSVLWGIIGPAIRSSIDKPLPEYMYTISGLFNTLIFYMVMLLFKKFFILRLYSKLRERTYKDRIIFSKKAVSIIEHLRLEIGKKARTETILSEARLHFKEDIEFANYENLFDKLAVDHAKELYMGLGKGKHHHLTVNEFKHHYQTEAEALNAFQVFAGEDRSEITGKELKDAIIQVYRERRRLNDNIRDMNGSISKLEGIFNFIAILFSLVFMVAYFDTSFLRASLPFFSSLLVLSFVFAESAKDLFSNIVFLFNVHPYDSGDIIVFRDFNYKVLEVSLYYTILERLDGQQTYVANAILSKEPLRNFRRSENQSEPVELQLSYMTPPELIIALEERMNEFYKSRPNMYRFPICVSYKEVFELNKLTIIVPILYKRCWQDWGYKSIARNNMHKHLQKMIYELHLEYSLIPQTIKMVKED